MPLRVPAGHRENDRFSPRPGTLGASDKGPADPRRRPGRWARPDARGRGGTASVRAGAHRHSQALAGPGTGVLVRMPEGAGACRLSAIGIPIEIAISVDAESAHRVHDCSRGDISHEFAGLARYW